MTKIDMTNIKPIRIAIIDEAKEITTNDRQETYGDFSANMKLQADIMQRLMDAGLARYSGAHNIAIGYAVGKLCRIAMGMFHRDNYRDGVNYIAEAAEAEYMFNNTPTDSVGTADNHPPILAAHSIEELRDMIANSVPGQVVIFAHMNEE